MATDPELLVKLGHKTALNQIAPVDDAPQNVHSVVELLLVFFVNILAIAKRKG